ncbi:enoyl-CoA hydratase [Erythrobacter sp. GH1-10]
MLGNEFGTRLFAAAFSVIVSASVLAYAIVPASPGLA